MKTVKKTPQSWSDEHEQTLVKMWKEGTILPEIANVIGKSQPAIRGFLKRNRERLGLEMRPFNYSVGRKRKSNAPRIFTLFDKQWSGPVPPKHWTITQSWGKQHGRL